MRRNVSPKVKYKQYVRKLVLWKVTIFALNWTVIYRNQILNFVCLHNSTSITEASASTFMNFIVRLQFETFLSCFQFRKILLLDAYHAFLNVYHLNNSSALNPLVKAKYQKCRSKCVVKTAQYFVGQWLSFILLCSVLCIVILEVKLW